MSDHERLELKVGLVLATYGAMTATKVANIVDVDPREALRVLRRLAVHGYAQFERHPHRGERRVRWAPGRAYEELYEEIHPGHPCPVRFARLGETA